MLLKQKRRCVGLISWAAGDWEVRKNDGVIKIRWSGRKRAGGSRPGSRWEIERCDLWVGQIPTRR